MKKEKKYFWIKVSLIVVLCFAFVLSFSVGRYSATDIYVTSAGNIQIDEEANLNTLVVPSEKLA